MAGKNGSVLQSDKEADLLTVADFFDCPTFQVIKTAFLANIQPSFSNPRYYVCSSLVHLYSNM